MTVSTHAIPVLKRLMPLKSGLPLIAKFRFKVDPLLPALIGGSGVKSKRGDLQPIFTEVNEKLLERVVTKSVSNPVIRKPCLILSSIFEPNNERRCTLPHLRFDHRRTGVCGRLWGTSLELPKKPIKISFLAGKWRFYSLW